MESQDIKMENLEQKIESILFYSAEPVSCDFLAKILAVEKDDIKNSLTNLSSSLSKRGVRLLLNSDEVALVTAPEFSEIIEKMVKEEREKDLGRAGIETLSIIAYKGPVSRREIEYIRGVNSQFAIRNLLLRGLIERKNKEGDERIMVYNITHDTLRFLGIGEVKELPEYEEINKNIEENITSEEKEEE